MTFGVGGTAHGGRNCESGRQFNSGTPLKIEKIILTHVRVPLIEPFRISSGAVSEKDGIVVELQADGLSGYGESSPVSR